MQSLYELLKASKGLPVSDSYAALWGKSAAESGIKTLTGRLPLYFKTLENKLRDWTIYGNNDVGKNLLEITAESQAIQGVVFTVDKQAGTVTATRKSASSSDAILAIEIPDEAKEQNLYFSGCPSEGSASTYNVYVVDYDTTLRALQWDGVTPSVTDYGTSNNEVRFVEGHRSQIRLRIKAGYDAQNVVFKPMLRKAGASADFEPYQIGVGEKTKNLLEITGKDEFITRGITFSHDKSNHTIRVNGRATGNAFYACGDVTLKAGVQYVLSGCPAGGSVSGTYTYQLYIAGHSDWGSDTGSGLTLPIMTEDTVVTPRIGVYTDAGELTDLVFKPMIREADTTADFIPYGYLIVITSNETYDTDIFIGDSPLTEGQSVSRTSTGIDIITTPGDNYLLMRPTFTDQPVMMIKYKE